MKIACHRCSTPTDDTSGLCARCRTEYRSPGERPYDDAAWRRVSRRLLAYRPYCESQGHRGKGIRATVADHWPESRKSLLARGVANPDTIERLRPLCTACHNAQGASHTMRFDNDPA